jgi:hypothetical protein
MSAGRRRAKLATLFLPAPFYPPSDTIRHLLLDDFERPYSLHELFARPLGPVAISYEIGRMDSSVTRFDVRSSRTLLVG